MHPAVASSACQLHYAAAVLFPICLDPPACLAVLACQRLVVSPLRHHIKQVFNFPDECVDILYQAYLFLPLVWR